MTEFFAEIGSNYITKDGPSYDRALELIEEAAEIGCTGVKFQYYKADKLWHPSMKAELAVAKERELPLDWVKSLSEKAKLEGLLFGLSVFDTESVEEVDDFVDYFKIASFEAGWLDLVRTAYKTGKRLMLSTGQISREELMEILQNLPPQNNQIDVLHCVSKYPAEIEDCNLNIIKDNRIINGYSDHTTSPLTTQSAITLGAKIIEVHLDLTDKKGIEAEHSWYPRNLETVIRYSNKIKQALGTDNWDTVAAEQDRRYKVNQITGLRGKA